MVYQIKRKKRSKFRCSKIKRKHLNGLLVSLLSTLIVISILFCLTNLSIGNEFETLTGSISVSKLLSFYLLGLNSPSAKDYHVRPYHLSCTSKYSDNLTTNYNLNENCKSNVTYGNTSKIQNSDCLTTTLDHIGLTDTDLIWIDIASNTTKLGDNYNSNNNRKEQSCNLANQIMIWVTHHKTGSYGLSDIRKFIIRYCGRRESIISNHRSHKKHSINLNAIQNNEMKAHGKYFLFYNHWRQYDIQDAQKQIKHLMKKKSHNSNSNKQLQIYLINMIRNPVSIVISGFYYHSKKISQETETWLKQSIVSDKCIFNSRYKIEQFGEKIGVLDSIAKQYNPNIIEYYESLTIAQFYHEMEKLSLSLGLYIEYLRFICHDWQEIVDAFFIVKDDTTRNDFYNGLNIKAYNVKFEYFWNFIDLKLFNKIKCKDNNSVINDKFGIISQNIGKLYNYDKSVLKLLHLIPSIPENDYSLLLNVTQKSDIVKWNQSDIQQSNHVTINTYDRALAVDAILKDVNVCNDLKSKSNLLDYWWLYPQYC